MKRTLSVALVASILLGASASAASAEVNLTEHHYFEGRWMKTGYQGDRVHVVGDVYKYIDWGRYNRLTWSSNWGQNANDQITSVSVDHNNGWRIDLNEHYIVNGWGHNVMGCFMPYALKNNLSWVQSWADGNMNDKTSSIIQYTGGDTSGCHR